jgi:hypothetical protein
MAHTPLLSAFATWLVLTGTSGNPLIAQEAASKPKIEVGFEERVRSEDWDNIGDHNDLKNDYKTQIRVRTRLWGQFLLSPDLEIMAGINQENRKITRPDSSTNYREVFFETLYADYKFTPALSIRAGRQNIMKGEGFVIFEGNPLEGSRSTYFNAIDLTWKTGKSTLEFMAISNPKKDKYLPRLDATPYPTPNLVEWDEQALGVYYTGNEWTGTTLEAYGFLKTEKNDYRLPTNPAYQPDRQINTVGSRVVRDFGGGWSANGEFAYEWGTQDARPGGTDTSHSIGAWGGYSRLKKAFDTSWKPVLSAGYIGMSGDNPNTSKLEGWDPLFSRWPRWSELYIYSQVPEKGVAYWTNTGMWEAELRFTPWTPIDVRATYYKMAAYQAPAAAGATFSLGKSRGELWEIRTDIKFNPSLKGHILYEHLTPGTFYAGQNGGYFLRFELSYLWKKRF